MITRVAQNKLSELRTEFPVVAVTGPRQSGKTTLVQSFFSDFKYYNLEELDMREEVRLDPRGFLAKQNSGFIVDEVQNVPDFFSYLQSFADNQKRMGQIILTGSQNFLLLEKISQSLSGRVGILELMPLQLNEYNQFRENKLTINEILYSGLYPAIYDRNIQPYNWYSQYIRTYIERDVRQIKNITNLGVFQRFIKLCAGRIGQLLNTNSLANDLGVNLNTVRSWLDILESSYVIFRLNPHHKNFNKRVVKQKKLYFVDVGLAAHLLGIESPEQVDTHYLKGNLFENLIISEFFKERYNKGKPSNLFFWRDHIGNEVDLLIEQGNTLTPIEIKSSQTLHSSLMDGLKKYTKFSLQNAQSSHLIYGGKRSTTLDRYNAHSWEELKKANWSRSFPCL
jgi:predicted AAA+ superfamily ATPase